MVARLLVLAVLLLGIAGTPGVSGASSPAQRVAPEPLTMTIDSLVPSVIPTRGPIRVQGSITNISADTWDDIGIYPLTSFDPLTTPEQLTLATRADPADPVGDRITSLGPLDVIESLPPGETATYSLRIPRSALSISGAAGVYWFAVQALGAVDGVREEVPVADGRVRTFLPYIPEPRNPRVQRNAAAPGTGSVRTALVMQLRDELARQPDGRVDQVAAWAEEWGPEGRFSRLVDFGAAAQARPLTWLIDPALVDAAAAVSAGNYPYDLSATVTPGEPDPEEPPSDDPTSGTSEGEPGQDPSGSGAASPTPGAEPSPSSGGADPSPDPEPPDGAPAPEPGASTEEMEVAASWLARLTGALVEAGSTRVLALPYGDLDVAAAANRAPSLLTAARERSTATLERLELPGRPGIVPPAGSLPLTAYSALGSDETILVTSRAFADPTTAPESAVLDDRILTTAPYVTDGPAPGDPDALVSIRQMILSEAAVRLLRDDRAEHSYVAQLPILWQGPTSTAAATEFFTGLDDLAWFRLVPIASAPTQPATAITTEELFYPRRQVQRELPTDTLSAARALTRSGQTLQAALTRNDQVAGAVLDAALTSVSYADRNAPRTARVVAERNRNWITRLLSEVTITAPPSLTLSSDTGVLPATVTNGLDYPVTVVVTGRGDDTVTVSSSGRIRLAPGERVGVNLDVTATQGVHNVELQLTDGRGAPLGASTVLPVRSAQVGGIFWVIIGAGLGLLAAAIVVRLVRRIRGDGRDAVEPNEVADDERAPR